MFGRLKSKIMGAGARLKRRRGNEEEGGTSTSKRLEVIEVLDEGAGGAEATQTDVDKYLKKIDAIKSSARESVYMGNLSAEEREKLVGGVMRYMLFKAGQNYSQPVSRQNISSIISEKHRGKTKQGLAQHVISNAQASFATIMGLEMKELSRASATGDASQKYYILRSLLPKRYRDELTEEREDKKEKSLLLTILMILSLSGDQMTEEKLWEHLRLLGLEKDSKHKVFGDPNTVVNKFVRQRYLQKIPKKSESGRIWLFQPGENALDEIDQISLNEAISKKLQKGENIQEVIELE